MTHSRRRFLAQCCNLLAGLLAAPLLRAAWPTEKFAPLKYAETLKLVTEGKPVAPSDRIHLKIPQIAENGAVVPVSVETTLENVESIAVLVEKNPVPLAAQFLLAPACKGFVSARIKMAETCDVIAVVKAGGQYYSAGQRVKVTIGGCGG